MKKKPDTNINKTAVSIPEQSHYDSSSLAEFHDTITHIKHTKSNSNELDR